MQSLIAGHDKVCKEDISIRINPSAVSSTAGAKMNLFGRSHGDGDVTETSISAADGSDSGSWAPTLEQTFALATRDNWRDARNWLIYTLLGGLLPFWGTALILLFLSRSQPIGSYLGHGELAVFCTGLLTSALPVMQRRIRSPRLDYPDFFHFASILSIAVALLLFASAAIERQLNSEGAVVPPLVLNQALIIITSFLIFLASVAMAFVIELINNVRLTPDDIKTFDDAREKTLTEKFEVAKDSHD